MALTVSTISSVVRSNQPTAISQSTHDAVWRRDVGECCEEQGGLSDSGAEGCGSIQHAMAGEGLRSKLQLLKEELTAMKKTDLNLLKQLIEISQTIRHVQRADNLRVTRSMAVISPTTSRQHHHVPIERQLSVPLSAGHKRLIFSDSRSNTEGDVGDYMTSFDESEVESHSEADDSSCSLNIVFLNSTRHCNNLSTFSQSHDSILTFDLPDGADQSYEDILRRNVRSWKMSSQSNESMEEDASMY